MSNCTRLILKEDALFQFVFEYQGGVCYTSKDLVLKGSDEMSSFMEKRKGLLCTFAIAVVSVMLDKLFPVIGSAVFAIILGMVLNQFWKIPSDFRPGINYSAKKLLHYSIIALGFTMSFAQVSQTGASSFPVTIVTISIAFLTALLVGNFFKLSRPLKILVGFGTAICGGSAIAAASPIIRAEDSEENLYAAIDVVYDKLKKQIRRYKNKLQDRHQSKDESIRFQMDGGIEEDDENLDIVIERRKKFDMKPMSPEEAVLQMDLSEHDFYMFRNSESNGISIVYRRKNGGYGLIESE